MGVFFFPNAFALFILDQRTLFATKMHPMLINLSWFLIPLPFSSWAKNLPFASYPHPRFTFPSCGVPLARLFSVVEAVFGITAPFAPPPTPQRQPTN